MECEHQLWNLGKLKVSANKRYLEHGSSPFFWMGDTAWLLFEKLTLEEAYVYLKNRKEKGFNVIHASLLHNVDASTIFGARALYNNDLTKPNLVDGYWNHVCKVVRIAEELGIYMGLLPVWGSCYVKEGILTKENVIPYVKFLCNLFGDFKNIIWILGGDIRGNVNFELFNLLGKSLKENDPERMITFHPFGRTSSSMWFHEAEWLDFNMFQSGHRRYDQKTLNEWDDNQQKEAFWGEDNYKYVDRDLSYSIIKPTLDGEPSYELIPQGLHDGSQPLWKPCDVRRYAYWSVFAGAMGHTYGHNAVMQFYNDLSTVGSYSVNVLWSDAIHHAGANHMKHLVTLMYKYDYTQGSAAQELLLEDSKEKYERVAVFASPQYILAYDYLGREFTLNLEKYKNQTLEAYWYDPTTGSYSYFGRINNKDSITVKPVKRSDEENDWILILSQDSIEN